jgi:outer membrane lipoprotein
MKLLTPLALALVLGACATAPRPLQGTFSSLLPDDAAKRESAGELVRWGGRIVSVEPQAQRSCFEIVALPLTGSGRPQDVDRSAGRFIACRAGFYDPEVFQAGREITVSGHIEGFETRKVGDFDYRYPRVAADVVYLWPEYRQPRVIVEPSFGFGWYRRW